MPEAHSPEPAATPSSVALWLPVAFYMAFIFGLSSLTRTPAMPGGSDKVLHALNYAGLGLLVARAVSRGGRTVTGWTVLVTMVIGTLYGVSDEFHQSFNPPRESDAADVLADSIGSGLGAAALYAWGIIRARNGL